MVVAYFLLKTDYYKINPQIYNYFKALEDAGNIENLRTYVFFTADKTAHPPDLVKIIEKSIGEINPPTHLFIADLKNTNLIKKIAGFLTENSIKCFLSSELK